MFSSAWPQLDSRELERKSGMRTAATLTPQSRTLLHAVASGNPRHSLDITRQGTYIFIVE